MYIQIQNKFIKGYAPHDNSLKCTFLWCNLTFTEHFLVIMLFFNACVIFLLTCASLP